MFLRSKTQYPVITYVFGFTGRGNFSTAFARQGLRSRVVLSAADTDRQRVSYKWLNRFAFLPTRAAKTPHGDFRTVSLRFFRLALEAVVCP